jgi:hypothetical protein
MKAALQHDKLFRYLDGQLSILLGGLEKTCLPPRPADQSTTIWPSARHLAELDSTVVALAIMPRRQAWAHVKCIQRVQFAPHSGCTRFYAQRTGFKD